MMIKRFVHALTVMLTPLLMQNPLTAVTVTLTEGDPYVSMGALIDQDGDGQASLAREFSGRPSLPNIGTKFPGHSFYPQPRRAIAEYGLQPVRDIAADVNAVTSARLRFYFDDVIFPHFSPGPWTAQAFVVEAYSESANGLVNWSDINDLNPNIGGGAEDDWNGDFLQTWSFQAGEVNNLVPGESIVGHFSPDQAYPAQFGDPQLTVYGMIGFEIDVTELIQSLIINPNVHYIGFRWISESQGGFWTSMDPAGHLPMLSVDVTVDEPLTFELRSTDQGPITGEHGGRPYHIASDLHDEAIYLTAWDWEDGHLPGTPVVWPLVDGILSWDVIMDPNRSSDRPEAVTPDGQFVYWDDTNQTYQLVSDESTVPTGWSKVYYKKEISARGLSFGNNGVPDGLTNERQHVLLSEFNLQRALRLGLDPNRVTSARLEVSVDRVVDMQLTGNNAVLLPSQLFVNGYKGDGVLNDFENAQADFERVNRDTADASTWLMMDGTPDGLPITDFELSFYKLIDPGKQEPLTISLDVTEAVRKQLTAQAKHMGFVFSCSPDGEYAIASVDLVDTVTGKSYLPALIIETNLE